MQESNVVTKENADALKSKGVRYFSPHKDAYLECCDNPFRTDVVAPEWDYKSVGKGETFIDQLDAPLFVFAYREDHMFSLESVREWVSLDKEFTKKSTWEDQFTNIIENTRFQTIYLIDPQNPSEWFGHIVFRFIVSSSEQDDTLVIEVLLEQVYIKPEHRDKPFAYIAAYEIGRRVAVQEVVSEGLKNTDKVKIVIKSGWAYLESASRRIASASAKVIENKGLKKKIDVSFLFEYPLPENYVWKENLEMKTREGKKVLESSKYSFTESYDVNGEKYGHVKVMQEGQNRIEFEFKLKDIASTVISMTSYPYLTRPAIQYSKRAGDNIVNICLEFNHYNDYLSFHEFYQVDEAHKEFVKRHYDEKNHPSVMWRGDEVATELYKDSRSRLAIEPLEEDYEEDEVEEKDRKGKLISSKYNFKRCYESDNDVYDYIWMNLSEHTVNFAMVYMNIPAVNFSAKLVDDVARPIIELQNGTIILDSYDDYLEVCRHYNIEPSASVLEIMIRLSYSNLAAWKASELLDISGKHLTA